VSAPLIPLPPVRLLTRLSGHRRVFVPFFTDCGGRGVFPQQNMANLAALSQTCQDAHSGGGH